METECAAEHAKMKEKHTCEVGWKIKPVEIIFFLKRIVLGAVRGSSLVSNMVSARKLVASITTCVIVSLGVSSIATTSDEIGTETASAFKHQRGDFVCPARCQCCFTSIFGHATC